MFKKIIILVITILLFSGCSYDPLAFTPEANDGIVVDYGAAYSLAPLMANNVEYVLEAVARAKFGEALTDQLAIPHIQRGFTSLTEMYIPTRIYDMEFIEIGIIGSQSITYIFNDSSPKRIILQHDREISPEYATEIWFGRSGPAAKEYKLEHNGITYGIVQRLEENGTWWGYYVSWAQYGQTFFLSTSPYISLEEALSLSYVQPLRSWELEGNAISFLIQGMENVGIFDRGYEVVVDENNIYRVNQQAGGRGSEQTQNMIKIGYRWLIDEDLLRYQYVLAPGEYEFRAERVINEPEIQVKRFEAGEIISSIDYTQIMEKQVFIQFDLIVTPEGYNDSIVPSSERK